MKKVLFVIVFFYVLNTIYSQKNINDFFVDTRVYNLNQIEVVRQIDEILMNYNVDDKNQNNKLQMLLEEQQKNVNFFQNRASIPRLDSIVKDSTFKYFFTYNYDRLVESSEEYYFDDYEKSFFPSEKKLFVYNPQKRIDNYTVYVWNINTSNWVKNDKYSFEYDQNGNISQEILFKWDLNSSSWINSTKKVYAYNANNRITNFEYYNWINNQWYGNIKYSNEYNDNLILRHFDYIWLNDQWKEDMKNEYSYSSNILQMITKYVKDQNSNTWNYVHKDLYFYDSNNFLISLIQTIWDENNLEWNYNFSVDYTNEPNGMPNEELVSTWDGNQWVNSEVYYYLYNSSNKIIDFSYYVWQTNPNDHWEPSYRVVYDFNSLNLITLQEIYSGWNYTHNCWRGSTKFIFDYDQYKNRTNEHIYEWDDNFAIWIDTKNNAFRYNYNFGKNDYVAPDWATYNNRIDTAVYSEMITYGNWRVLKANYYYSVSNFTETPNIENDIFNIFPNPAKDFINIVTTQDLSSYIIEIFDINGRLLLKSSFYNSIDISSYPQGIYFLKVGEYVKKVLISR